MVGNNSKSAKWDEIPLAPVIVVRSKEDILADRAIAKTLEILQQQDPNITVHRIDAEHYRSGLLAEITSPSLFGESTLVICRKAEKMNDAFLDDAMGYLQNPGPNSTVIIRHGGGNRGKRLLDASNKAGFPLKEMPDLAKPQEKTDFIIHEARNQKRKISGEAADALVRAIGENIGDLLASLSQLLADVEGPIEAKDVATYYAGRIEARGYNVADAAIKGDAGRAIALARHALAVQGNKMTEVAIVGALAAKLRNIGYAFAEKRGEIKLEKMLGLYQARFARDDSKRWSDEGLAQAILAVAQADAEVKGGSRDPGFALERAIRRVAQSRNIR